MCVNFTVFRLESYCHAKRVLSLGKIEGDGRRTGGEKRYTRRVTRMQPEYFPQHGSRATFPFRFSMYADDARVPAPRNYKVKSSLKSVVRMATNEQRERVRKNTRTRPVGRRRRRSSSSRRRSSLVVERRTSAVVKLTLSRSAFVITRDYYYFFFFLSDRGTSLPRFFCARLGSAWRKSRRYVK